MLNHIRAYVMGSFLASSLICLITAGWVGHNDNAGLAFCLGIASVIFVGVGSCRPSSAEV